MTTARISRFVKNSDFTTQNQRGRYTISLSIPANTYGYVTVLEQNISVGGNAYMENVVISTTTRTGESYPTNYVVLDYDTYYIYLSVYQPQAGAYRLRAVIVCPSGSASVSASTVSATINLSLSPFVN